MAAVLTIFMGEVLLCSKMQLMRVLHCCYLLFLSYRKLSVFPMLAAQYSRELVIPTPRDQPLFG